jgi:uncharacterized protein (TIGR00255 family)
MKALRSMTGFGSAQGALSERLVAAVRLGSVNARFLELSLRVTPRLESEEIEAAARRVLAEALERGRVTVAVDLRAAADAGAAASLQLHWEVAEALLGALARRPAGLELAPLSLRDLLAVPGFAEGGTLALTDEERAALLPVIAAARDALVREREREAAALLPGIRVAIAELVDFLRWVRAANAEIAAALLARLRERLARLLEGVAVPEERLAVEAGVLADRADVTEEVDRLGAHLDHLESLLAGGGPVGKKLDFLLQELLREVNTTASKCREAGMGERVVAAKSALEKLREQFANLE